MGQRYVAADCESYLTLEYSYSSIEPFPLSKDGEIEAKPELTEELPAKKQSFFTAENLNRWLVRFTKAKKYSRRADDLRRQALLHSAIVRTKEDLKVLQNERQRRWREFKSVMEKENEKPRPSYFTEQFLKSNMASDADKMADDANKMAATATGVVPKRGRCDCVALCSCSPEAEQVTKKARLALQALEHDATSDGSENEATRKRRSNTSADCYNPEDATKLKVQRVSFRMEDDEDLQSLAVFLDAVHFETRHSG